MLHLTLLPGRTYWLHLVRSGVNVIKGEWNETGSILWINIYILFTSSFPFVPIKLKLNPPNPEMMLISTSIFIHKPHHRNLHIFILFCSALYIPL